MYTLMNALYLIAGMIWGDWQNWKKYYPTILFLIVRDLLYNFLLYKKPMWLFQDITLPNHTMITLLSMTISYTVTVLIYLGRFPDSWGKRFLWFLLWSSIFLCFEYINSKFGFISYHNGWNMWWSVIFTGIIFLFCPSIIKTLC
ncbi:CBO0543 family protein [Niallia nealsonii]|uniref:Uncharacterized protein n=1 Tax=Niallia nealsonii TaxID=115979 RepID=A0A2N0Z2K3_9BACI|nr:CBO0543 family protein [Niallia nealsonii]PKG23735.1 hypothetical protein CWS01_10365 [Niallia nealsonii]